MGKDEKCLYKQRLSFPTQSGLSPLVQRHIPGICCAWTQQNLKRYLAREATKPGHSAPSCDERHLHNASTCPQAPFREEFGLLCCPRAPSREHLPASTFPRRIRAKILPRRRSSLVLLPIIETQELSIGMCQCELFCASLFLRFHPVLRLLGLLWPVVTLALNIVCIYIPSRAITFWYISIQ